MVHYKVVTTHDILNIWDRYLLKLDGSFDYKYCYLIHILTDLIPLSFTLSIRVSRVWKCQIYIKKSSKYMRNINGWRYCFLVIKLYDFDINIFIPYHRIVY